MWWLIPLITGLAAAAGGIYSANKNAKSVKETNRLNQQLANQQNAWNETMWTKTNEYNDPSNQIQRYKDAGLNPNMLVDGGVNSVAASSPQSANLANQVAGGYNVDFSALANSASSAVQLKQSQELQAAQIDNLKSQTKYVDADTQVKKQQNLNMQQELVNMQKQGHLTDAQTTQVLASVDQINKNLQVCDAQIALMSKQGDLADATKRGQVLANKWQDKQVQMQLNEAATRCHVNEARVREINQSIENALKDGDLKSLQLRIGQSEAVIKQNEADLSTLDLDVQRNYKQFRDHNSDFYNEADYWSTALGVIGRALGGSKDVVGLLK